VRRQIPFILLAVLVVLAAVFTLISYRQSTASGSSVKLLLPCKQSSYSVKPSTFIVSCADANSEFTDLHWTDWGSETAYATGIARWNDCTPTCVAGHWRSQPATLWAWDPRNDRSTLVGDHNVTIYTKVASSDRSVLGEETVTSAGGGTLN
jgi:hypothetical protein